MNNPTGTIQSLLSDADGPRAIVEVENGPLCARCAAGKGCGAGLLGGTSQMRRVEAAVRADLKLAAGDRVELVLPTDRLLRATLISYGLPLSGALLAASIAWLLGFGDTAAALSALAGIGAGWIVGRWQLGRGDCLRQFEPVVGKRLDAQESGA
ncbi:MAG: SoxR reducing system RseC family protein [Gammaproteobacteria bacterium]|nr:SoxR reducing system RseC family protein [Gammaproteobacteria bacterium]MDH5303264.1 SoxR reducing system RseC family protein [Gammaproteobacteria bacterium]